MAQHDVAGALFTSLHRHTKIEGRQEVKPVEMEGTGSVGWRACAAWRIAADCCASVCKSWRAAPSPHAKLL